MKQPMFTFPQLMAIRELVYEKLEELNERKNVVEEQADRDDPTWRLPIVNIESEEILLMSILMSMGFNHPIKDIWRHREREKFQEEA